MNYSIIVLEGVNCTLKDTVETKLNENSQHAYTIINRFTGSQYAYGKLKNRNINYKKLFEIEELMCSYVFLTYLTSSNLDIVNRYKLRGEKRNVEVTELNCLQHYYLEYLLQSKFKFLVVNTSILNVEQSANLIIDTVERLNNETVFKIN